VVHIIFCNSLEDIDYLYKDKAEQISYTGDYYTKYGIINDFLSQADIHDKIDNYVIYLIDSRCDNSGYCNHGEFRLVAFNELNKEIVYQYSYW